MSVFRCSLLGALLLAACVGADPPEGADLATAPDLGAGDQGPAPDQQAALRPLRSQDVSILYPLPANEELSRMVWGNTLCTYGRLIPQALFQQVPAVLDPRPGSSTASSDQTAWYNLRVVGVRLDPCFGSRGEVPDAQCRNQVRLVLQGMHPGVEQAVSDDGALHALYELPRAELLAFTRKLLELTVREGDYAAAPLQVHPILLRQGYAGSFAAGLKDLLRGYLGESRLVRMTFFSRSDTLLSGWRFGAFDRVGQGFARAEIATTMAQDQRLGAGVPVSGTLEGTVQPETGSADRLLLLLSGSLARAATPEVQQQAFGAALRIENPLRHTPDTIDCVSCHAAQAARAFGEQGLGLSAEAHPDRYAGAGDLRLAAPRQVSLENVHAFSYLGAEAGLSQRTVNESAAVAQRLSELLSLGSTAKD